VRVLEIVIERKIATFSPRPISVVSSVLPRDISRDGFVFEDVDNVTRGVAYDCVDGQAVFYWFPTAFVKDHKRLVISEGNVRIYR
jgi:hypothetical protein